MEFIPVNKFQLNFLHNFSSLHPSDILYDDLVLKRHLLLSVLKTDVLLDILVSLISRKFKKNSILEIEIFCKCI